MIEVNGHPIRWGMWANREFANRKGLSGTMEYLEFLQTPGVMMDILPEMILLGAEYAAMKSGVKSTLTESEVLLWIDDNGMFEDGTKSKELMTYILSGGKELQLSNDIHSGEEKKT